MRRGSVTSWQHYGRKSSATMGQLGCNRTQFIAGEGRLNDIEYARGGGCFLSHTKSAFIVIVFIIGIAAAGCIGAYINSAKSDKDPVKLKNEDIGGTDSKFSLSPYVHPSRYQLELQPIVTNNTVTRLTGRVIIEFQYNGTKSLHRLTLNANEIRVLRYRLLSVKNEDSDDSHSRRRRNVGNNSTLVEIQPKDPQNTTETGKSSSVSDNTLISNETSSIFQNDTSFSESRNNSENEKGDFTISTENNSLAAEINVKGNETDTENGFFVIYPEIPLQHGNYSIEIDYQVKPNINGFRTDRFDDSENGWYVTAQLKPSKARYLFPLFEDVKLKAHFVLSVTRPRDMRVISNTPLKSTKERLDNDTVVDTFEETPRISAHNLAVIQGKFNLAEETNATEGSGIRIWSRKNETLNGSFVAEQVSGIIWEIGNVFALNYPFGKLDIVALPLLIRDGDSSPGLISLKESIFDIDQITPNVTKRDALKTIVRLIAEQWLGGLVNMQSWSENWILDGSLQYLQYLIHEKIDPTFDSTSSFIGDVQTLVMDNDGYSASKSLDANVDPMLLEPFLEDPFGKGACIIRMLHGVKSDNAFFKSYRIFVNRWKYAAVDSNEFWKIMSSDSNDLPSGLTMAKFMNPWITERGYPLVTVTRDYESGSVSIKQEPFVYDKNTSTGGSVLWDVPLTYISTEVGTPMPTKIWLPAREEPTVFANITKPGGRSWLLFNVKKNGYYRVNYDQENWKLLAAALQANHEAFQVPSRVAMIDDAFALARGSVMGYQTVFDLIEYMRLKEKQDSVWRVVLHHFQQLDALLYGSAAYTAFHDYVRQFVWHLYQEHTSKISEGTELTLIAMKLACLCGLPECRGWANEAYSNLNTTSAKTRVPSYVRETVYCTVAQHMSATDEWVYFYGQIFEIDVEEKRRILSSFGCFESLWILQTILEKILNEGTFDEEEIQVILKSFSEHAVASQVAFKFLRQNWPKIVERYSSSYPVIKAFMISVTRALTSEQDIKDLSAFEMANLSSLKAVGHVITLVESKSRVRIAWLQNVLPLFQKSLEETKKVSQTS